MQATLESQAMTLTRRPMDIEDYLNIVRRNVGWIAAPALTCLTISVVVAFFWPDTFISTAQIRVVPAAVPERFVPTNMNVQMSERVNAMSQTILSRNTLTNIIQTYDLYRKERSRAPMEDIIEQMRKDILPISLQRLGAGGGNNAAAFRIGFSYENRYIAQKVTRDLMTRFIDENSRERFQQSQQTTQFLQDQYDQAKMELDKIETQLTQYRVTNAGRLPDQMGTNMNTITVLESRLSTLNTNISRTKQEQMLLETELRAMRERLNGVLKAPVETSMGPVSASAGGQPSELDMELARADRDIQGLERALERMLEQYTPTYPDVQRLQGRLKAAKKEKDDLLAKKLAVKDRGAQPAAQGSGGGVRVNPARSREVAEIEAQITRLQGQIRAKDLETERYIREISDAERKAKEVQGRIETGPIGAAQLEQLTRDYELAKRRYDGLKINLVNSKMANEVEERKQGETLEVLDLPSLPETPTNPNRPLIIVSGAIIGLVIGGALATARELKNNSLKTLKDIRAYTQFNVLGSIPLLENDMVVKRRRRIGMLAWSAASVLSVTVMAGAVYYYYSTKI